MSEQKKNPAATGQRKQKNQSKDKQSFLVYKNFYTPIRNLSNEQLGRLFRAILIKFMVQT